MKKFLLILVLAIFSLANLGSAQFLYWDGGAVNITTNGDGISQGTSGSWDNSTVNWDQGAGLPETAWISGTNAFFGASGIALGAGLVTLNAPIIANAMTVNTTNYIFTDGGNTANMLTINTITNNQITSITNNIVNSSTFTKAGGANLVLTATSSGLAGNLAVNGGTLILGGGATGTTGPTGFGNVTVATNATLELNPAIAATYGQTISGGGSLYVHANTYTTVVTDEGNSTFTGNVTVYQANLIFTSISDNAPNPLGYGTNIIIGLGGSATYLTYEGYGDASARTITLSANAGTATEIIADGFGPLALSGSLAFGTTNQHTLTLSGTSSYVNTFGGNIPDNATTNTAVVKAAASVWLLSGSNTFSGGLTINAGTLLVTNDDGLGAYSNEVYLVPAAGSASMGTIKSISNNVTLVTGRTIFIGGVNPASFGVYDSNNLYVASYLTGTGAVEKASSSYMLGTVRFSCDTNNYTGDFAVGFGNTEFTSVANQGIHSSLGVGATATGGKIYIENSTSSGVLRYVGTANSSTARPLSWTNTTGPFALDVTNTGTIAYLATANLRTSGTGGACNFTLEGSNTGTNTLAQGINDDGGSTSLIKTGAGRWILTGVNTYSGGTAISGGTLTMGAAGQLGSGSYSANLTNNGTFNYNSSAAQTLSGVVSGSGAVIENGSGTLTLSGADLYSSYTAINAGTLALGVGGSINDTTNISIASGATLDVSALSSPYNLSGNTTLSASGTGTTVGSSAAAIKGASGGTVSLGSRSINLTYDGSHPALYISQGTLSLNGNAFTVNSASPLAAGTYTIAQQASGSITSNGTFTVSGTAIGSGEGANISVVGGSVNLVIYQLTATPMTVYRTAGTPLMVALSDIATNWSDASGSTVKLTSVNLLTTNAQTLSLINVTTNSGTFVINSTSFVGYTNGPNVADQFSYSIADSNGATNIGLVNIVIVSSVSGQATGIVSPSGGMATVSFAGIPGDSYTVERSTNLMTGSGWVTIWTTNAPAGGLFNYTDSFGDLGGVPTSAYYRLSW